MRRLWCLALTTALWPAACALAVEPPDELGKVTLHHERRAIGREERDNTFRPPGSVIEAAKAPPVFVDAEELAARQRAMAEGRSFTTRLTSEVQAAVPAAQAGAPAASRRPAGVAAADPRLGWMHFAVFALGVGGLAGLAAWTVRRARTARAKVARLPVRTTEHEIGRPTRRTRTWIERDLRITMGHREE